MRGRSRSASAATLLDDARRELGDRVQQEMLQSQIEISSPVLRHSDETLPRLMELRRALGRIASSMGLRLVAAGTLHVHVAVRPAVDRFDKCRSAGSRR
jgi:gamma-glutamyl:cysteine ligase YbdK (ATP-grasp superfamily)